MKRTTKAIRHFRLRRVDSGEMEESFTGLTDYSIDIGPRNSGTASLAADQENDTAGRDSVGQASSLSLRASCPRKEVGLEACPTILRFMESTAATRLI